MTLRLGIGTWTSCPRSHVQLPTIIASSTTGARCGRVSIAHTSRYCDHSNDGRATSSSSSSSSHRPLFFLLLLFFFFFFFLWSYSPPCPPSVRCPLPPRHSTACWLGFIHQATRSLVCRFVRPLRSSPHFFVNSTIQKIVATRWEECRVVVEFSFFVSLREKNRDEFSSVT